MEKINKNDEFIMFNFHINNNISMKKKIKYSNIVERSKNGFNIGIYLNNILLGFKIEVSVFEYSILYLINHHYDKKLFYSIYTDKIGRTLENFKINKKLIYDINNGLINPYIIAFIPPQGLYPKIWENIIEKQNKLREIKNNFPTTDLYRCKRCGKNKCITRVVQTRAADESLTTIAECIICHNIFTV
jgi:DNA-directed RNA polymerase subunit M/transcription elongation factor TFIIS